MNAAAQLVIAAAGFVASVITSVFVAGSRWGRFSSELRALQEAEKQHATKDDVGHLREQIAEIKGMFTLAPKRRRFR